MCVELVCVDLVRVELSQSVDLVCVNLECVYVVVEVDRMCVSVVRCRVGDAGCHSDNRLTGAVPQALDKLGTITHQRFSLEASAMEAPDNRFGSLVSLF